MNKKTWLPFIVATLPAAIAAQAQPGAAIEEIIVSARRTAETVQTVPVSMTALSGDALQNQSIQNINDVQAQVPNFYVQAHPSDPQSLSLAIRGQKQNDIAITLDPSVGIYVDNLYYPRTMGLRGALVDLERIEVLRGPQGTLYGRNTTGGAMAIYTKDPSSELGGSLMLSGGNYDRREVIGIVNVPVSEASALRLVAQHSSHDGYGSDGLGRDLMDEESNYLRAKFRTEIGDRIEAVLFGSYQKTDGGGAIIQLAGLAPAAGGRPEGGLATLQTVAETGLSVPQAIAALESYIGGVGGDPYETAGLEPGWSDFEGSTVGLDISVALTDAVTLRSITGHERLDRENNADFDGTPFTLINALRTTDTSYTSQEFQLLGGNDEIDWVGGIYVGMEEGSDTTLGTSIPLLNPASPTSFDAEVDYLTYAVFSQVNWTFMPDWRLTVGVRYSWDDREVELFNGNASMPCLVPAPGETVTGQPTNPANGASQCPRTFDDKFSEPSWLVSLDHQITEDVMGYAKIAYGYRTGGRNQRGLNTIESFSEFGPETVTEYEAGFKADLLDRRLRLNFAAYWDDYEDIQRSSSIGTLSGAPTTIVTNAAGATIKGIEAEAVLQATEHLTLRAGVGLTDAEYDDFVDLTGDRSDEEFDVPEWTANASVRYAQPRPWGEWAVQVDYQWLDEHIQVPAGIVLDDITQESYGLLNSRITFVLSAWDAEVSIFGKNLTDEEYFASSVSNETSLGYSYSVMGEPRTYGIEVTKRFGAF